MRNVEGRNLLFVRPRTNIKYKFNKQLLKKYYYCISNTEIAINSRISIEMKWIWKNGWIIEFLNIWEFLKKKWMKGSYIILQIKHEQGK